MTLYLIVALSFALGYLLQQPLFLNEMQVAGLTRLLNRTIIVLALPALILTSVPGLQISTEHLYALLTPWVITALSFMLVRLLQRVYSWPADISLASALLLSLGNTAFLGVPLIRFQLGDDVLLSAIVFDQLGSFLVLSFVAMSVIAAFASDKTTGESGQTNALISLYARLLGVLRFPPFLSLLLALALTPTTFFDSVLWHQIQLPLGIVAKLLLPLAMVVIGLQFRFQIQPGSFAPLAVVLIGRMLITPLLVLVVAKSLLIDPLIAVPAVMQSAMPPMVTGVILLINAGIAVRFATSVLGIGTLSAALTLPFWFYITERLF